MKTKNVLGLDLGTNSIGGALIKLPEEYANYGSYGEINWLGSRILPDSDYKKAFDLGQTNSPNVNTPAANRRIKRGSRRLKHRYKLRRSRLIKVFKTIGWLSEDFPEDFKRTARTITSERFSISDFLPFSNKTIQEFNNDFHNNNSTIPSNVESSFIKTHVPEDWIIYYLRKKALTEKIEISELVRIIYMFNQRRGFKSSRKDLKDSHILTYEKFKELKEKKEYDEKGIETKFVSITKVLDIIQVDDKPNKGNFKFKIVVDDERIDSEQFILERKIAPDWKGKELTLLVTQKVDKNHKFTQNKPDIPSENDWALCTTALDEKIEAVQYPGKYFYDELKKAYHEKKSYKIRQFPVYRWRYQKELEAIWLKQCELNPELNRINNDKNILRKLAEVLYPTQAKNRLPKLKEFMDRDLLHIISNDIIYYQRELKSQKKLINECPYEKFIGKQRTDNNTFIETGKYGLKCVPKSSPVYQEFRIWQDIHNLRIIKNEMKVDGVTKLDIDFTEKFISDEVKVALFELFDKKLNISEIEILKLIQYYNPDNDIIISKKKETPHSHRINLFAKRDTLKGNETKCRYRILFEKNDFDGEYILNNETLLYKLWHIDYSISSADESIAEKGIMSALGWEKINNEWTKKENWQLFKMPLEVALDISKLPELNKEYGAYSSKAIKQFLPIMRTGKYWKIESIEEKTKNKIEKIINGEFDEDIVKNDTIIKIKKWEKENRALSKIEDFHGLPNWLTGYIVYGLHSEQEFVNCKNSQEFNDKVILKLKNNDLRNPVVESIIRETLLLVRDLWRNLEEKNERIDEIHIELGRNLKNNSEEKKNIAKTQEENYKEKKRIKEILTELLKNESFTEEVDEVEPKYENGELIFSTKKETAKFIVKPDPENPNDIEKFRIWKSLSKFSDEVWDKKVKDEKIPSDQQIKKYILWLSQNCRSPYTGKIIPISKLFDPNQYEIEHVIPRAKMKNDSKNNLVIAEWGVNKAKGSQLAANFIKNSNGKCSYGDITYNLLTYEAYEKLVNEIFKFNRSKRKNLLATEVPSDFVERQINDTRYITKKVAQLLKSVVGDETKIIFTGGTITSELKKNWGLTKEWKKLMLPRFKRLEKMYGFTLIKPNENDNSDFDINVPENEKLDIKRIDHRHHALDALIVAATTREHIRYLNSLNAVDNNEELQKVQRSLVKGKIRDFKLPWSTFTKDAKDQLESTIASFKVNNRIISKPRNLYTSWGKKGNQLVKIKKEQQPNKRWLAIRRSLFKEPLGTIWIKQTKEVSIKEAFEIEINRQVKANNQESLNLLPYIYDKTARTIIKNIIMQCQSSIDETDALKKEIESYLKKNKKEKGTYALNGMTYGKITIAEFKLFKTKRMSFNNKEYMEKLTLEKMLNDFPYFNTIGKLQFNSLLPEAQNFILEFNRKAKDDKKRIFISESKKMNDLNWLFLSHILHYNNNPKEAFGTDGIIEFNKKAKQIPSIGKEIKSITRMDGEIDPEDMFNKKFYETDKGAMAYFVIYENLITRERTEFQSIPTHKAIEKIIAGKPIAEDIEGYKKMVLSPGDLVYVLQKEEYENFKMGKSLNEILNFNDKKKIEKGIYKVAKFSKKQCYFIKANIADLIIPYNSDLKVGEFGSQNYQEINDEGIKIVNACLKIKTDRLGNITKV